MDFTDIFFAEDTLALTVYPEDYMGKLVDYCMVKIYCLIRIQETNQTWSEEDDFILEKPRLEVEVCMLCYAMLLCCKLNIYVCETIIACRRKAANGKALPD